MTVLILTYTYLGMRGQPTAAIAVDFTATTITVCIFGYAVWSGILAGTSDPQKCSYSVSDNNMQPIIKLSIEKQNDDTRWNEFISSVGVDSLLQ